MLKFIYFDENCHFILVYVLIRLTRSFVLFIWIDYLVAICSQKIIKTDLFTLAIVLFMNGANLMSICHVCELRCLTGTQSLDKRLRALQR